MENSTDAGTLPAEQPKLTGQEKFRRGGFRPAAEVIAETEAQPAAAAPHAADPAMQEAILADETVEISAGYGVIFPEDEAPAVEAAPEAEAAPEEAQEEPKFRIGSREFTKQEEAWAYAEQLEQERLAADAFRQGVEAASGAARGNLPQQPAAAPEPTEIDPEYYTNPQAYFQKREAQIIAKATQTIDERARQTRNTEQLWTKFYTDYPDLAVAREFVDLTMQQNWNTLQHIETSQALKQLADKTRAKLKPIRDAALPKTELPKVKTAASPGGTAQVTPQKTESRPLSFVEQHKNLRKSRAQLR